MLTKVADTTDFSAEATFLVIHPSNQSFFQSHMLDIH